MTNACGTGDRTEQWRESYARVSKDFLHDPQDTNRARLALLGVMALPRDVPILDVGAGDGNLHATLGGAGFSRVWGFECQQELARLHPQKSSIVIASATDIPYASGSMAAAVVMDVLHHLTQAQLPRCLAEMRRVLRPGGVVAVRDSDYSCFSWAPLDPGLTRWLELYRSVARRNDAEPDAGRFLKGWALAAGFRDVEAMSSTWTYSDPESCAWWGGLWADRCELSAFGAQAVEYGLATRDELATIAAAWRRWSQQPDAFFAVLHGEVLARA